MICTHLCIILIFKLPRNISVEGKKIIIILIMDEVYVDANYSKTAERWHITRVSKMVLWIITCVLQELNTVSQKTSSFLVLSNLVKT